MYLDFFVTFYSFWRPNCKYITRDGFVLSYRLLKFDEKFQQNLLVVANSFVWTLKEVKMCY